MTVAYRICMAVAVFALALGMGLWLERRAASLGLVQWPGHRSSHDRPTPTGGGLGFVLASTLAGGGLMLLEGWWQGGALVLLALLLAATGLRDDLKSLPAWHRLGVQAVASGGLLLLAGGFPEPGLTLTGALKLTGPWMAGLSLLACLWWVNLFNFMDGIDGLAAAQAIFMLAAGGLLALQGRAEVISHPAWFMMAMVAISVGGFLCLNWAPARIFMGDVGSTWLGFVTFALALLSVRMGWLSDACWLILAGVFITDATLTLWTRMVRGERWYEGHRSHAYQRLSRRWQGLRKVGHRRVTLAVIAINLAWLLPWAWASLRWPAAAALCVAAAYAPLVLCVFAAGAGRADAGLSPSGRPKALAN